MENDPQFRRLYCFQVHLNSSAYGVLRGETTRVDRVLNRQPPDRTAMKQRAGGRRVERKQRGYKKHREMSVMRKKNEASEM